MGTLFLTFCFCEGQTSAPSTLSYLDSGVVFVGSRSSDSQLVRLQATPVSHTSDCYVEILDSFTNLGPIVDFCVMDLDRQGQCQVLLTLSDFEVTRMNIYI